MKQEKDILKPVEAYERVKDTFSKNVDEFFDNLVKESDVKKDENKKTCDELYKTQKQIEKLSKKTKGKKVLKGFLIFLAILFYLAMVVGIVITAIETESMPLYVSIPLIAGGALLGTGMVLIICLDLNKKIKKAEKIIAELKEKAEKLEGEAWAQMKALNESFTWNMPQYLITKTLPLIQLDRIFTPARYEQLAGDYGYQSPNKDCSVVSVQSGSILGNPFLFERIFYTYMGTYTYTGSIVITWTEYSTDSNGNTVSRTRTQTLTASLTKPKPYYDFDTELVYGNQAAPKLSFSRSSSNKDYSEMSERKLKRLIKKSDKKLTKKARKDVSFTKMGNSEFEALFNATDRNHEAEFRLLFTPIAQQNMIELLKSKPYGDDFNFNKYGPINIIRSAHSQGFDYHAAPWLFQSFDFEKIQETFKMYFRDYFQSMYFDLAPILSIPLYQQYKSKEYIYKSSDGVTDHEIESLANYYGPKYFCHPNTATDCILKSSSHVNKGVQTAVIDCYSYEAIRHITNVPVRGGDGYMHNVPVTWYEYRPLRQSTAVKALDWQGYQEEHTKQTIDQIYKKFGIKHVYGQKGLALHMGHK